MPEYFSLDLSDWRGSRGDTLKERWLRGIRYALPPPKHHSASLGQASKMGMGPDYDCTLLARSELPPRDHVFSNRATKVVQAVSVAPMECKTREAIPKVMKN